MTSASLHYVNLESADLNGADLRDVTKWKARDLKFANNYGIKNPPGGFLEFAKSEGAVEERPKE